MITVTDLKTAFGSYYRNEGQGMKDLVGEILVPSATEQEWAPLLTTDNTQVRKVKSTLSTVLQPWQKGASPAGDLTLAPLSKDLWKMKYETDIDPDEIEASYAGFLATMDTNDRKQWNISKYIAEQLLIAKGREDYELSVVFHGNYSAPTPGTAGAVATSADGLKTQIADDITATTITPVNGPGSWSTTASDFCTEIEAWIEAVRAVSARNRQIVDGHCDKLFMSKALAMRLAKGIHTKYNVSYPVTNVNVRTASYSFLIPFTNIMAVGLPSMAGSNRIIMTPAENRLAYIKNPKSEMMPQMFESGPRELLVFCDFYKAVSYWDPALVFVNQLT